MKRKRDNFAAQRNALQDEVDQLLAQVAAKTEEMAVLNNKYQ